ncbi:MAG: DUF697 domain-containing protein [Marinoscillum sp.]|uniref:DUF697 domain-containing protein n=2 Tax=Marinoscillum sp. TaxID=2024838 RepID=UPI0032F30DEC
MISTLKKIVLPLSILVILGFLLFMINQISGVYLMLKEVNELTANVVLVLLSALGIGLVGWPVLLFLKLPRAISLPTSADELPRYRQQLLKRLKKNELLRAEGLQPQQVEDLQESILVLNQSANKVIQQTATAVFLTTSVSQNGKLDALTILATQSRMVWKIAHIYYQRPSLRELMYLYSNVAGSSFLASEIEDLDISQQVEPVISSFLKNSAGKSIPVIGPTANIILDSLLEGSTNAFLTLRVGNIALKYCACNEVMDKKSIRKSAFTESASQLKGIVMKSSGQIMTGLLKATRKAGVDTLKSGWEGIKNTGVKVAEGISEAGQKMNPFKKKEPEI